MKGGGFCLGVWLRLLTGINWPLPCHRLGATLLAYFLGDDVRNSALWYSVTSVVVAVVVLVVLSKPTLGLAALGGFLGMFALFLIPKERIAGVAGCLSLALMVIVPVQNVSSYGPLKYGVLAAVALLTVVTLMRRPDALKGRRPGLWLLVAYFALLALGTPNSMDPGAWALLTGAAVAGLGVAVPFAAMSYVERRRSLSFIVGLASAQALYALMELVLKLPPLWGYASIKASGDPNIMYNQIFSGIVRAQGTLGHPLPLALLMLVGIALVVRGGGPRNGLVRGLVLVLLVAGCFVAGSRSALTLALVGLCFGFGRVPWKSLIVGGYLLGLGILIAIANGFRESDLYQRFANGSSVSHRTGALEAVPGLLTQQDPARLLFGNGYFSAYQLFRQGLLQVGNFFAVDNQFVMTLVEAGLVGLVVLGAIIVLATRRLGRDARLGFLAVVAFFLTFDVLSWPSGMALFAAFVGLAFSSPATVIAGDGNAISDELDRSAHRVAPSGAV